MLNLPWRGGRTLGLLQLLGHALSVLVDSLVDFSLQEEDMSVENSLVSMLENGPRIEIMRDNMEEDEKDIMQINGGGE